MKQLLSMVLMGLAGLTLAQDAQQAQYAAYLNASKTMWKKSVELAKKESGEKSFEVAFALYGLLNNTMANQDEETFEEYKDETIDLLKEIIEEQPNWGEPKAVLSSTYGLVMAYSPMKGMILGMKSSSLMSDAMELQSDSPLVQKLYGGSKLYTPEMWGGDPEIALASFSKALEIYQDAGKTEGNWLYLDTMMGLAMSYKKTDQDDKAKSTLQKAISLEPQYYWAKAELEVIDKS